MTLKPNIKWTNDCCGKQDYDGAFIEVSTRYWPRGGSALILEPGSGELKRHDDGSPPSAHSTILVNATVPEGGELEGYTIAEKQFEGETEEEVKAAVEEWVQEQFQNIITRFVVNECYG